MDEKSKSPRTDFDGAWKLALDRYLDQFLQLCFPIVHAAIDWSRGAAALDQELQEVVRDAETGKRRVDKLYRVYLVNGTEEWVLVHVEVQGRPDRHLPERLYRYYCRITDCHRRRAVTLAVLADSSLGFRPWAYEEETLGCRVRFEYPTCKLLDFPEAQLEREDNPVAIVIAAHRAAQQRTRDPVLRKSMKWELTRRLYERGYSRENVLELFRLIDWLLYLPEEQRIEFRRELMEYEASKFMPYITSIEEMGRQEGTSRGVTRRCHQRSSESGDRCT
jgi:hypothetical protein